VGLKGAPSKLELGLTDFRFADIGTATESIDWKIVPVVEI
jgi:hypothetical protein